MHSDVCPYCRIRLEVGWVKFRFNHAATVSICPNCAMASADEGRSAAHSGAGWAEGLTRVVRALSIQHGAPRMRRALVHVLQAGIIVIGGYAGLVWLDSATNRDVAPAPQPAATISNWTMPSEPVPSAPERSAKLAEIGQDVASHEAVNAHLTPSRTRGDEGLGENESTVTSSSVGQQAGSDQARATASSSDQVASDPPAGGCMPIGVTSSGALVFPVQCRELLAKYRGGSGDAVPEPTPAAPAEQVSHDQETVGAVRDQQIANVASTLSRVDPVPRAKAKPPKPGDAQQVSQSRNDRRSHQRFARLLKDPLALTCMACVLFGR